MKKFKPVHLWLNYRSERLSEQARVWYVAFLMCELLNVFIIVTQLRFFHIWEIRVSSKYNAHLNDHINAGHIRVF